MKNLADYKKIIFLGGGVMADRLYQKIERIEERLIGVIDLCKPEERTKKVFKQLEIQSPEYYRNEINDDSTAVVVAIGNINVALIVRKYIDEFGGSETNLFVANPYTSLRFFYIDNDLAKEEKISYSDVRYQDVQRLFTDLESKKLYDLLTNSKSYNGFDDSYELVPYLQLKDMYYWAEDYWLTYSFKNNNATEATVIDCGAYNGDSILPLCNAIPQKDIYYYAFEPVRENADLIRKNQEYIAACKRLEVLERGVGEVNQTLSFVFPEDGDKEGGRFVEGRAEDGAETLEVCKLDDLDLEIKERLYIKMDIEGSELVALKGAENLIKTHRPCLAICMYHRKNDLLEIPTYIAGLVSDYRFYLRGGYHTILWAIPDEI